MVTADTIIRDIGTEEFHPQGGEGKLVYLLPAHRSCISMKEIYGVNYPLSMGYVEHGYMDGFFQRKGFAAVKDFFFEKQRKDPGFILTIEKNWKKDREKLLDVIESVAALNISKLPKEQLLKLFHQVASTGEQVWKHLIFIDSFDAEGAAIIEGLVGKDSVSIVTHPEHRSYTAQERLSMLKIAQIATGHHVIGKTVDEIPSRVKKLLEEHQQQFYWYKNNYAVTLRLSTDDFFHELQETLSMHTAEEIRQEIEKCAADHKSSLEQRKKIVQKLTTEKRNIVDFFQKMAELRDLRKATNCMFMPWMRLLLEETSKKFDVPLELLENVAYWEIDELLNRKFRDTLKQRATAVISIASDKHGMVLMTGKDAERIKTLLEKGIMKNKSELIGRPAVAGKVVGVVKIINKVEEFKNFKEGDILVSSMTRPEFVPIMKKAAAIVTDEGGVTCHAAIVARELGKPCIVGTEIATKVLKNGMKVEVDATKGLVKVIK